MQEPRLSVLAEHPVFAGAAGILGRLFETYDFLVECVAPGLFPPDPDGHRLTPDTAFEPTGRHRLDQAARSVRDTSACWAALNAFAEAPACGTTLAEEEQAAGTPMAAATHGCRLRLLRRPSLPAPAHREFAALFRRHLSAGEGADHLTEFTARQAHVVHEAVELMLETAPELSAGLLEHGRYVVAVDGPDAFDSASTHEIPGTAFVAVRCLRTPERAAEALLHELVHLRLYDLQATRSIYAPTYDTATAATVAPEWHRDSAVSRWPVDRALAAAHVYVHLCAWFDQRRRDSPDAALETSAEAAAFRASSLLAKVAEHDEECLGPSGRDFLGWLGHVHRARTGARRDARSPVPS